MATIKVTFALDQATISRLREAAVRMTMPKSEAVRAAIRRILRQDRPAQRWRKAALLRSSDELAPGIPERRVAGVKRELESIRRRSHALDP